MSIAKRRRNFQRHKNGTKRHKKFERIPNSLRATTITAYLKNGGTLERAE